MYTAIDSRLIVAVATQQFAMLIGTRNDNSLLLFTQPLTICKLYLTVLVMATRNGQINYIFFSYNICYTLCRMHWSFGGAGNNYRQNLEI